MKIVTRKIKDLKFAEYNPRKISDAQIVQLKKSIEKFDFLEPVIVNKNKDRNDIVVGGHQRLKAMLDLGYKEVPTVETDLNLEQEKELNVRLNKNTGDFDYELLLENFDIENLLEWGFEQSELNFEDNFLNERNELEIPEVQDNSVSVLGDFWILGNHRLICGDSTIETTVKKLFGGLEPNLMITDPPYGVNYSAWRRAIARGEKISEKEKTNNIEGDCRASWQEAYSLFPGDVCYVWHAAIKSDIVKTDLENCGFEIKSQIIWKKHNHTFGRSNYHWKHEPCWYGVRKDRAASWLGGRKQNTVWEIEFDKIADISEKHPTQKPTDLYIRTIENHTCVLEPVYDPFGGSGSCIIACEKTNRAGLSIELDPKFCDVIIRRWENFTGKEAINENGQTFRTISQMRASSDDFSEI
jgi:DNA modification methylase